MWKNLFLNAISAHFLEALNKYPQSYSHFLHPSPLKWRLQQWSLLLSSPWQVQWVRGDLPERLSQTSSHSHSQARGSVSGSAPHWEREKEKPSRVSCCPVPQCLSAERWLQWILMQPPAALTLHAMCADKPYSNDSQTLQHFLWDLNGKGSEEYVVRTHRPTCMHTHTAQKECSYKA